MSESPTTAWRDQIDLTLPCWEDYTEALASLFAEPVVGSELPGAAALQSLLAQNVNNVRGKKIQFVSPALLPDGNYEELIFNSGRVSTRTNNWHDLFNALVWWRFPALKAAMNATHFTQLQKQSGNRRGRLRDALTLWDECGVIVASINGDLLEKLAARNWRASFQDSAELWQHEVCVFVCGHALLEKYLDPYKSITAHALLVQLDSSAFEAGRQTLQASLDEALADKLLKNDLIKATANLSPLPLSGIPGWWKDDEQNDSFYADTDVFRIPSNPIKSVPIIKL